MRSKAPLALIEIAVMVLVFALAAALSVRVFVRADAISKDSAARDRAVIAAENAAETIKACNGDLDMAAEVLGGKVSDGVLIVGYDASWQTSEDAVYTLSIQTSDSGKEWMQRADIAAARTLDAKELYRLTAPVILEAGEKR